MLASTPFPRRLPSLVLLLGCVCLVSAEQVEITAGGRLEHASQPSLIPNEVRPGTTLVVTFLLEVDAAPVERDPHTAGYRPASATFKLDDRTLPLREATFIVQRYPGDSIGPGYGYLLRGLTTNGWFFSVGIGSSDPAYAPDFSVPTTRPAGPLDFAHDVTLRDPAAGWGAYGDATIWKIESRTEPRAPRLIGALARFIDKAAAQGVAGAVATARSKGAMPSSPSHRMWSSSCSGVHMWIRNGW